MADRELVASTTRSGWRIRVERPGQRLVHYLTTKTYPTKEEAQEVVDHVKDRHPRSRLGLQWQRVTVESGEVDWVHN